MCTSTIGKQAENYAEVIVGQIVNNFETLYTTVEKCEELKEAKSEYDKASPTDKTLTTIDALQKRVEIIEMHLGDVVCDGYSSIEPLAVGLFGEWGSGKTHQLKLIKKTLLSRELKEGMPVVIPVFFNAWRFEKEEHIILPLFQTLLDAVENHERTFGKKMGRTFKSTVYHLKNVLLSLHQGINWSSAYKTARGVLSNNLEDMREVSSILDADKVNKKAKEKTDKEQVGEQTLTQLLQPDQLQSIYLNIPQWIEKITLFEDVNFVFLIDDLDRCLPENTLKMLESIKLFLDVPSCAFVLAVDDDVVERGVVHHYRDYLQQNNNAVIYMDGKQVSDDKNSQAHELPITGHEYLEKMIQLPVRLPVIDTVNVRNFLEEHSKEWKQYLGSNELAIEAEKLDLTADKKDTKKPIDVLLDFFETKIPPKPRKIKRTALLFETKLSLLDGMKIDYHHMHILVAKVTLLELFAPKLLRFIQNNSYDSIYNRLVEFKDKKGSLAELTKINAYIERKKIDEQKEKVANKKESEETMEKECYYTKKDQQKYVKMMRIVKEHYTSRILFDLDTIFTATEDKVNLQKIIEMREKSISIKAQHKIEDNEFKEKLFKEDDVQSWNDAFKVDKLFEQGKATLTSEQLKNIMKTAKERNLHFNHEWRNAIVPYITGEQLKSDIYFEMCATTVTKGDFKEFVEYSSHITEAEKNNGMYIYHDKKWENKKDASWKKSYIKDETDNHPVVGVSWNDAKAYIEWKNKSDSTYDYVLPTENEWYLACNNDKDSKWHFGNDESLLKDYAWYAENSGMKTHEVKSREPNDLGLYDMHGNVWEWCEGWYDEDKDMKVLRGGSWNNSAFSTESTFRNRYYPSNSNYIIGFRLQRTLSS